MDRGKRALSPLSSSSSGLCLRVLLEQGNTFSSWQSWQGIKSMCGPSTWGCVTLCTNGNTCLGRVTHRLLVVGDSLPHQKCTLGMLQWLAGRLGELAVRTALRTLWRKKKAKKSVLANINTSIFPLNIILPSSNLNYCSKSNFILRKYIKGIAREVWF